MSAEQKLVGGLWCREVLAVLGEYIDGELDASIRQSVETHVAGCDWCARFGKSYAGIVQALRDQLRAAEPPAGEVVSRLLAAVGED